MPTTAAISGESTAGSRILLIAVPKWIAPLPAEIQVAPIRPPKRACEELDGMPTNQVAMFQRMAPMRPPKMIAGVTLESETRPLEMVLATATERNAPIRLKNPA